MAGTNDAFDADAFRTAISTAMTMGLSNVASEQPTFYFAETKTWPPGTALDNTGLPFDPSVQPTVTSPTPKKVPCAVEFSPVTPEELPVGTFRKTKVILTLLDTDYALVKTATEVAIGGDRYLLSYSEPPLGLFDVTVYRFVGYGKDEK